MIKVLLTGLTLGCCLAVPMSAAPINCNNLTTLQQYIDQSAQGGCVVQDKLFTDFTYTGGGTETASNVSVTATLSMIPGIDIHGFTFVPAQVWTTGFTVGYTVSVLEPTTNAITAALDQINLGPVLNGTTAVSTKSNGQVYNLSQSNLTVATVFPAVTAITSSTAVTIPTGSFLISLEEQYTQTLGQVPEPATFALIAGGLIGLRFLRRRKPAA